jgi:hypothetical protein
MNRKEGLEANVGFFNQLINSLNEGGIWVFKATMELYTKKNGKLVATNKKAYNDVLRITPTRIHNIFELDLSSQDPQLN